MICESDLTPDLKYKIEKEIWHKSCSLCKKELTQMDYFIAYRSLEGWMRYFHKDCWEIWRKKH